MRWVNAVIHELRRRLAGAVHEFVDACGQLVEKQSGGSGPGDGVSRGQPPIANISILGRFDVAAERSSE